MTAGATLDKEAGLAVVVECQQTTVAAYRRAIVGKSEPERLVCGIAHELQQSVLSIASGMIESGYDPMSVFRLISNAGVLLFGTGLRALHPGELVSEACFEEAANHLVTGLAINTGFVAEVTAEQTPDPVAPTSTRH